MISYGWSFLNAPSDTPYYSQPQPFHLNHWIRNSFMSDIPWPEFFTYVIWYSLLHYKLKLSMQMMCFGWILYTSFWIFLLCRGATPLCQLSSHIFLFFLFWFAFNVLCVFWRWLLYALFWVFFLYRGATFASNQLLSICMFFQFCLCIQHLEIHV